jgi:formate hydrogenlyase subunit 3/multisubunit Na+/H+ antiporter MnhD subunit
MRLDGKAMSFGMIGWLALFVVLICYGKWFLQGFWRKHPPSSEKSVEPKSWLITRTITAWILVTFFVVLSLIAIEGYPAQWKMQEIGRNKLVYVALLGLVFTAWWVRELKREWKARFR